MMKIIMIGPVYPYKGGIAHYTSLMTQALSKKHDVTLISYSLQYPKILYPRSSQKDYENASFRIEPTHYLINTVNPFTYVKTANFIKKQKPDLIILQWWHPFFAPAYRSILGLLKKQYRVIFICHNVFPHEKFPMQRVLTRTTLARGDAYIVHSKSDEQDLLKTIPTAICKRTALSTFNSFNLSNISKSDAQKKLGIPEETQVLLFFGFVREYKGLKHLLSAMPKIAESIPKCKLLVVGDILESEKDDYMQRTRQTGCEDSIILVSEYVPDKEVENYFSACDLVVLPYESATQSGIVQIAYSFNKPVVATAVGGLPEVVLDGETGYLVPPCDPEKLADAVIRYFKDGNSDEFKSNIKKESYRYSWERMVEIVDELGEKAI